MQQFFYKVDNKSGRTKDFRPRGFTMFFAVLVSGLALAIGIAIYDLVVRGLHLSSTAEQSQYAMYAADSGAECALYWDAKYSVNKSIFATSSGDGEALAVTEAFCGGVNIVQGWAVDSSQPSSGLTTTTLQIGKYYATIAVQKYRDTTTDVLYTTIYSHGFNTPNITAPGAVERELRVTY